MLEGDSGDMVLIKHSSAMVIAKKNGQATVTGMTRFMPGDLQRLVKEDLPAIRENGLTTNTSLIVVDGDSPPKAGPGTTLFFLCVIVGLICVIPFLFPSTVFATLPARYHRTAPGRASAHQGEWQVHRTEEHQAIANRRQEAEV